MHSLLLFVLLALSPFWLAAGAPAQYPDHPIRMIVPQAAGSSTDTLTRVLGAATIDRPDFRNCRPSPTAPAWAGVIAPAGVPQTIVDALNAAINRAIHPPAMNQFYATIGDEPADGTAKEFAALIASDSKKWGEVIERAGIRLE
jgi:tripartite-type tricarboxylate transporter receptor subunit TctC